MGRPFVIHELARTDKDGRVETLEFTHGVNLLVGAPNAGKTQWLRMLDYLLGNEHKPDEAFDDQLAAKYVEIRALATIGDQQSVLVRRWHDPKLRPRVVVDSTAITLDEFNDHVLERLGIHPVRYPQ